jgi:hypothetical protein
MFARRSALANAGAIGTLVAARDLHPQRSRAILLA